MEWTTEDRLDYLLRLPWTIVREVATDGELLLRVAEIPSAVGNGDSLAELEGDMWESLRASLEAYVQFDDAIPLPPGISGLPWQQERPSDHKVYVRLKGNPPTEIDPGSSAAAYQGVSIPEPV